jgi:nicotinate phosphoribosyltransferase
MPLLEPVMRAGKRTGPLPQLTAIRERAAAELERLPAPLRSLQPAEPYPVEIAAALQELAREVDRREA